MIANPQVVDFDAVWQKIKDHILEYAFQQDIDVFLYFWLRNECMELIRESIAIPAPDCTVLQEFAEHPGQQLTEEEQKQVSMLLSMFNRKQFDYFMKRYFFFDAEVCENARLEKQIRHIFQLRGDAYPLRWFHLLPVQTGSASYARCLEGITYFFLDQIHGKDVIIKDPAAEQWMILQRRFRIARRVLPIGIVMFFLFCAAMYLS